MLTSDNPGRLQDQPRAATAARATLQLIPPSSGSVTWLGSPLNDIDRNVLKAKRRGLQFVFQDPLTSLNPSNTVGASMMELLKVFEKHLTRSQMQQRVHEIMERVGLSPALNNRYPHELSGVWEISHRILVMYLGTIVELADTARLFGNPRHPYTQQLISAVPLPDPEIEKKRQRIRLKRRAFLGSRSPCKNAVSAVQTRLGWPGLRPETGRALPGTLRCGA